jgi:hypothetical protein
MKALISFGCGTRARPRLKITSATFPAVGILELKNWLHKVCIRFTALMGGSTRTQIDREYDDHD